MISGKGSKLLVIADFHGEGMCEEAPAWELSQKLFFSFMVSHLYVANKKISSQ